MKQQDSVLQGSIHPKSVLESKARLVDRDSDEPMFVLTEASLFTAQTDNTKTPTLHKIDRDTFLNHVHSVASTLPPNAEHVINLCHNRYCFAVTLCAAIVRKHITLLPQNKNSHTQDALAQRYAETYIVHDGLDTLTASIPNIDLRACNLQTAAGQQVKPNQTALNPHISYDQLVAIAFTSGSTGQPKANPKTWHTIVESTRINAHYMLNGNMLSYGLATVMSQHMWGLETSVLLPLRRRFCISDAKPLFPGDIQQALVTLPSPRCLISTPIHLRACQQSGLDFPNVERVLCATAPLARTLATATESHFNATLIEIYGCSEVGSMAARRSTITEDWTLFDGIHFTKATNTQETGQHIDQEHYIASAAHLLQTPTIQDRIEFSTENTFRLLGRDDDMIEIAGKRGSLAELTNILLSIPDIEDGIVFMPPSTRSIQRPAALVVSQQHDRQRIQEAFSQQVDAIFTPRPIRFVEKLPREENGKLQRAKLLSYYEKIKKS